MVFYGNDGQLEYDFVVAPKADPARIALVFEGAERLEVDSEGMLLVHVAGGAPLRFHKPVVYQQDGSTQRQVAGAFAVDGRTAKFTLGEYDRTKPLVIDPVLKYSTYFSGGYDYPLSAVGDASGKGYVVGAVDYALSQFPTTPGAYQTTGRGVINAYIAKFSPSGALLFSTFLGGSGYDAQSGGFIQVDSAGNVWVSGLTSSTDFPVTPGAWQPACQIGSGGCQTGFLAKLYPTGTSLLYSTYTPPGATGIALDNSGNVYVAGWTTDPLFPTTPNAYLTACPPANNSTGCGSAFFLRLNPSLSGAAALVYSSFFSDNGSSVNSIAADGAGMVYLTGTVAVPPQNQQAVAFVVKFDLTAGTTGLVYFTPWGGDVNGSGTLATPSYLMFDAAGRLYVAGFAQSNKSGLVTSGAYQTVLEPGGDAFVTRLDPATGSVLYGTLLGGSSVTTSVGADSAGNVYAVGWTSSASFPLQNPIQSQFPSAGSGVMFVASFDPTLATLRWSTFLGDPVWGSMPPQNVYATLGFSSAFGVDKGGNVFVAGLAVPGVNLPTIAALQPAPPADAAFGYDG